MASGITDNPNVPDLADCRVVVEYTLNLPDYHALDMFLYDNVIRKRAWFRLKFYGLNLLKGGGMAVLGALLLGCILYTVDSVLPSSHYQDARFPLQIGCAGALLTFVIILIGMIPGSFLHQVTRAANEKRFRQARLIQSRAGIISDKRRFRVVMTPEWFMEAIEFRETGNAVEITEHKETRVWWAAVTSIDVTDGHAIFSVTDKGFLLLPQRAFADKASFRTFVELARSYREVACLTPAPPLELSSPKDMRITR